MGTIYRFTLYIVSSVNRYIVPIKNIEHLDLIIDQVLILLPESFFYKPDINSAYFKGLRSEISEVKQKMNSYGLSL